MADPDPRLVIASALRDLRARAELTAILNLAARLSFWGGALLLVAVWTLPQIWLVPLSALLVCLVPAAAIWLHETPDDLSLAKQYDQALGLADRFSTSVDLLAREPEHTSLPTLLADTVARLLPFRPALSQPITLSREGRLVALPFLLLLIVAAGPRLLEDASAQDPVVAQALANQATKIARFANSTEDGGPGAKRRRGQLEELASALANEDLSKKDALKKFSELMDALKEEQAKLKEEEQRLREQAAKLAPRKDQDLTDDLHRGDYEKSANRIAKLLEELKEKRRKAKEKGPEGLDELRKIEEEEEKLQELKAKLLRLMALHRDLGGAGRVLDFLRDAEGELGELDDPKVTKRRFARMGKLPPAPPNQGQVQKVKRRLVKPKKGKPGAATVDEWAGEEERSEHKQREQKQKLRERQGEAAVTQTSVANDGSRSTKAAKAVLKASQRAAEDTIQRQRVPVGYRRYLRRYFKGLEPPEDKKR
ncbi:MAG: hypothetical protein JKY65_07130 [Planctomycetes bacterium]|nr:hypothetical protein [Planctomycetota bacterium]